MVGSVDEGFRTRSPSNEDPFRLCVPYPCAHVVKCVCTLVKLSLAVRRLSERLSLPRGEHALIQYWTWTTMVYGNMRQTGLLLAYVGVRHIRDSDWLRRTQTHKRPKAQNFPQEQNADIW